MDYQEEWNYNDDEEEVIPKNINYKYLFNNNEQKQNYAMNLLSPSNYTQRLNIKSRQNQTIDNKILNSNYNTQKNYNNNINPSMISNIQLNSNSSQYYSQKNKYLITFNSNPRKFDSKGKISSDGVIRGYTSNCSFYVSGSSDLKSNINYQNNDYKSTIKKENDNKPINKTAEKRHIDINKNIINNNTSNYNRYINKNNYIPKENDLKKDNKIFKSSTETNYGQYKYTIPVNLHKIKEQKPKINYTQTEPSNNVIYFSKNTSNSPSINAKYNSNYNNDKSKNNNKNNYYKYNINNSNNNQKKEYKTSTNVNLIENTRKNYFQTESEPKTVQKGKRTNTPNISRLDDRYISKDDDKKYKYTKIRSNLDEEKKPRHTTSEIPHNYVKQKYNYNLDKNILKNINQTPDSKYSLIKNNSNINFNINYNRYNNITPKPREREYGTRTQNYSFNNRDYSSALLSKNEKEIEIYELPKYKDRSNYIRKISPKKYDSHSINYSLPKYNRRNFSVHTETSAFNRDRNYLRNNEYEVSDVQEYKRNQKLKNINNNIREYNSFERGRINISDNKKEIENDEKIKNSRRESNHHKVYISSNLSQNKRYKTSTQNNNDIRRNKYTLGNLNEYEVEVDSNNKYDKYNKYNKYNKNIVKDKDKNIKNVNVNINKNNYFKEMKNLEEELEIDDNEQNEYVPPRQLFDNKNKKTENNKDKVKDKININLNKYQRTPPSTSQNYLNNYYQRSQLPQQKSPTYNPINLNNIKKKANYIPQKISIQSLKQNEMKIIPKKTNLNKNNQNIKIEDQQEEDSNDGEPDNKQMNKKEEEDNINQKPKYGSYFGDSNNNYYEVKGMSAKKKEENEEEEEENENDEEIEESINNKIKNNNYLNQIVRNVNFNIQSENIFIPAGEADKDEKEADEQQIEEDEQINIEENNDNDNNENIENNEDINYDEDNKNYNENQIQNNNIKGNYVITNDNNINIENNNNEMEQITEENNENENMQDDGVDEEGEAEGEEEEAMKEEGNMATEDKIEEEKENLEGENEVDFDIDEEEAMNEEEMGNEEYNEYLEGEEIDDNIDEINENDEEEMIENENENDNEENNGE